MVVDSDLDLTDEAAAHYGVQDTLTSIDEALAWTDVDTV